MGSPSIPASSRPSAPSSIPAHGASTAPFLAIELKKGDARFSFFALHELRIECFFAADNATDEALRRLAAVNPPA